MLKTGQGSSIFLTRRKLSRGLSSPYSAEVSRENMYLLRRIKKLSNRGLYKVLFGPQVGLDVICGEDSRRLNDFIVQGTAEQ